MDKHAIVAEEWKRCMQDLTECEFLVSLESGEFTLDHYKCFLRETYYNTSQNPRNMALFQAHLRWVSPPMESRLLKHAAMEVGHNELALEDLAALGEDVKPLRKGRPLATTAAMAAFAVFQIQYENQFAFLGYVYHLEALAVTLGERAMESLTRLGIPQNALSFLKEHSEADPVHMKWNRDYLEEFIRTDQDLDAMLYGLRGTCVLHGVMFQGIMDEVRKSACRSSTRRISQPN